MSNPWMRWLKIWAGAFVAFMVVLAVVRVWPSGGDSTDSSAVTTSTSTDSSVPVTEAATPTSDDNTVDTLPPVQLDQEMKDALTITFSNVSCPSVVEKAGGKVLDLPNGELTYQLKDDTLVPVGDGGRLASAYMAPPVVNRVDPKASLDEIILSICQGPNYGGTVANMFANMTAGDTKLVDLNPSWLPPYGGDQDQINDLAHKSVGTIDGESGYFVKPSYIRDAELVAELLIRARLMGYGAEQSVLNYHLAGGGMGAENFPEVELSPIQENLDALMLEVADDKTGQCLLRFGFNMLDKRPEVFGCGSNPTCTSDCGGNGGTTTTVVGRKGEPATTTPPPPTTQPSGPTTTLQCVYGTHRDPATGLCVSDSTPSTVAPPGTIPSTSSPPGPGTTVQGP